MDFDLLTTKIAKGAQITWLGFVNLFHDKYQGETWKDTAGKSARLKESSSGDGGSFEDQQQDEQSGGHSEALRLGNF